MSEEEETYPTPWEFDFCEHPTPHYSIARIYAADSTKICSTNGPNCKALAEIIVNAVNNQNSSQS